MRAVWTSHVGVSGLRSVALMQAVLLLQSSRHNRHAIIMLSAMLQSCRAGKSMWAVPGSA